MEILTTAVHRYRLTVQVPVLYRSGTANNTANYLMEKTFRVLPTTNHPTGDYTITLYYTQAEVNGWQAATGQNINSISLIKTANQISGVTPSNPNGAGAMTSGNASVTTIGTNVGLSNHFSTGFSGFGAGIVGSVLPIHNLEFRASIKNDYVELDWQTSAEENSSGFDVERSYDGVHFEKIGFVSAAGNSTIETKYSFSDPALLKDEVYYRLREIDLDNRFAYSEVRKLQYKSLKKAFIILNNPFTNSIEIQWQNQASGPATARLLDITGKEIYRANFDLSANNHQRLDFSGMNISAGIYLLELRSSGNRQVERVIKQ